jgi:hypothetical protein
MVVSSWEVLKFLPSIYWRQSNICWLRCLPDVKTISSWLSNLKSYTGVSTNADHELLPQVPNILCKKRKKERKLQVYKATMELLIIFSYFCKESLKLLTTKLSTAKSYVAIKCYTRALSTRNISCLILYYSQMQTANRRQIWVANTEPQSKGVHPFHNRRGTFHAKEKQSKHNTWTLDHKTYLH